MQKLLKDEYIKEWVVESNIPKDLKMKFLLMFNDMIKENKYNEVKLFKSLALDLVERGWGVYDSVTRFLAWKPQNLPYPD